MAEVFVPQPSAPGMSISIKRDASDSSPLAVDESSDIPHSLNDTFVFPPQATPPPATKSHHRGISNTSNPSIRPPSHPHKPSNLSLNNLPLFDFGFHAQGFSMQSNPSPTPSPVRLTPPSGHSGGHRRGGSEFVGGDITHGGPVIVNISSAEEDPSPNPPSPAKGPPPGRRGHAHRRSHAASQSDVRIIMQAAHDHHAVSAPLTPSGSSLEKSAAGPTRSNSHPGLAAGGDLRARISSSIGTTEKPQTQARVGFSDNLEFIPRPLSTISSETSSSMSTIRVNHSVSGSVSSFVSGGASSPPPFRNFSVTEATSLRPTSVQTESSPTRSVECHEPPDIEEQTRPVEPSSSTGPSSVLHEVPEIEEPSLAISTDLQRVCIRDDNEQHYHSNTNLTSALPPQQPSWVYVPLQVRPRTSPETRPSNKQQRVKTWTETILHRKEKQSPSREKLEDATTLSSNDDSPNLDFMLDNITFDDDTTTIIEEPHVCVVSHPQSPKGFKLPPMGCLSPDIAQPSPMIDLDVALDTPSDLGSDASHDYFGRLGTGKRRLHSSGETGGFIGPGMHYHRRAESAPEMEPFERSRGGFPRLGSNPTMEDAIVEEDEGPNLETKNDNNGVGLGVNVVEAEAINTEPIRRSSGRSVGGNGRRVIRRITTPPNPFPLLGPVQIVAAEEEPRFSVITKSSDESSITPTVSPDHLAPRPASAPLDCALQTPSLTYNTTPETPSAVSSADYSKTSFDVREPRIHTARSSMTDRVTLNSSKAGDFSSSSIYDVPSLVSSSSTMLSGIPNRFSGSAQTTESTERAASLSAVLPSRPRPGSSSKRASLASLSKLMGGPYNKSKLNIAETLPADTPERPEKKRNRISRMMRFWKSKEKLSPAG